MTDTGELRLEFAATLEAASEASRKVRGFYAGLPRVGDNVEWLYVVELIVSELCTNIARHAYGGEGGRMLVEALVRGDMAVLRFMDQGMSFDPDAVPEPDFGSPEPGGRGLFIVRESSESMRYESTDGRNVMTVEVRLP